ncbi:MAG: M20/M25/M40 family metallo-hydrolase, partial [Lachnospiraceae bacterium]|nr:M20/M25/M40 family metallo-hydrolase [Lachnospiraceae bacterium]
VWGRGADDCKSNIIAEMEAMEYLAGAGFEPDYDIYLLFGYNEEVGGGDSIPAPTIAANLLKERGIRLGCVLDEGGGRKNGRAEGIDADICSFTLGEKGSANFEISRMGGGGHSSNPQKDSPLVYVARAILAIEENPLPYRLIPTVADRCRLLAPYMKKTAPQLAELMSEPEKNFDQMIPHLHENPMLEMLCRTSFAVTMAQGSEAANIMPNRASFVVNVRLLQGDTIESVKSYLESIIPEGMEVRYISGSEATPISVYDSKYADALFKTSQNSYPDIVRIPDLLPAGTDSRFMYPVCDCVYRFASFYRRDDSSNIHKPNENMSIDILAEGSSFYVDLLTNYYGKNEA